MSDQATISARKAVLSFASYDVNGNPFSFKDVDILEIRNDNDYHKIISDCRFYYKHEPIIGAAVDKTVDIAINDLHFDMGALSDNEARVFEGIKPALLAFAANCALEYLISGLVVPEYKIAPVGKDALKKIGVKKYEALKLPVSMWLRDPASIVIKKTFIPDHPSYFAKIDQETINFILSKGKANDGMDDTDGYEYLKILYPDFVKAVEKGNRYILLESPIVIRRKVMPNSVYPTPYLFRCLEAAKHKRNLRRMDYSLASRVISAIQLFKLGSDEFPITEDDADQFLALEEKMAYRGNMGMDTDRIYQLFANHTLNVEWIMPPVEALLDDVKYKEPNADIIYGLGFPRILITGETERSGSSDPEFASMSPVQSMEAMRKEILPIIEDIVNEVVVENNFKGQPKPRFAPINLHSFKNFAEGMISLYDTGNISRETFTDAFGYKWADEILLRQEEVKRLEELGLTPFAEKPYSNQPDKPGNTENNNKNLVDPQNK